MKGNRPLIMLLIAILAINVFLLALPQITVKAASPGITIDGKFEDWATVDPQVVVDDLGDTQPWSSNTTFTGAGLPFPANAPLYYGNTSETAAEIPNNDMARDLYKFYAYKDATHLYLRLDVNKLPSKNWMHGANCDNSSIYNIIFDTTRNKAGRSTDYGGGCDTNPPAKAPWEYKLAWGDGANYTGFEGPTTMFLQANDWNIYDDNNATVHELPGGTKAGELSFAHNVSAYTDASGTHSSFEIKMPRTDLSIMPGTADDWDGGALFITIYTIKAGETTPGWTVAFDPQLPGNAEYSAPPSAGAWGSDAADVMPGGVDGLLVGKTSGMGAIKDCMVIGAAGPRAAFTYSPFAPYPGEIVTFDSSASAPGWNQTTKAIVKYEWTFGDGTPKEETGPVLGVPPRPTTHRFAAAGSYNVTLKVTSETGVVPNTDTTWKVVTVLPGFLKNITADGILTDWAGVTPAYTDALGDLQPWCTNLTILGQGSTRENSTLMTANNDARDLKVLYVAANDTHVFLRVDVKGLPSAFWGDGHAILNSTTGKPYNITETGPASKYYNASAYAIIIDTDFVDKSGRDELGSAGDTGTLAEVYWERRISWGNGTGIIVQDASYNTIDDTNPELHNVSSTRQIIGNLTCGMNLTASGSFEMAIPRTDFPTAWDGESLRLMVTSWKPGEWNEVKNATGYLISYENNWTRCFDPQDPGTLGEVYSEVTGENASGSDMADVIPGGVNGLEILTPGSRRGQVLGYLNVPTPKLVRDTAILRVAPLGLPAYSTVPGCDATFAKWHPTWKYEFYIEVLVKNRGTVTASNVVVSLYNGTSLIGTKTITLGPHADENVQFKWVPVQNLTYPTRMKGYPWPYPTRTNIKANVTVVSGDVNATNNQLNWGTLTIRYPGDAGKAVLTASGWTYYPGDGKVYIEDLGLFGKWGWGADRSKTGSPRTKYEAFGFWCDFSVDGKVSVEDLAVLGKTWGAKPIPGKGIY